MRSQGAEDDWWHSRNFELDIGMLTACTFTVKEVISNVMFYYQHLT